MRRIPKQKRSQALVEALLDATLLVIGSDGIAAATTARIAERAGVSVGSLYQYFDRKEDLYEGVLERFVLEMSALIDRQYQAMPDAGLSEFVREMLHAIWAFLERDDGRYLYLARYWNQMDSSRFLEALEHKMLTTVSQTVLRNPPARPVRNIDAKAFVLVNSVMLTLVRYIAVPAPGISRDRLVDQFVSMADWMVREASS